MKGDTGNTGTQGVKGDTGATGITDLGQYAGTSMVLGTADMEQVIPGGTATNLGSGDALWDTVYATNGILSTSDARVKTEVQPLSGGLATLMQLQPKTYYKHKSRFVNGVLVLDAAGQNEAGFLAQEMATVIPTAVYMPKDTTSTLLGVRYEQVIPYTVEAVQELKAENDALAIRVAKLEQQLAAVLALVGTK